MSHKEMCAAWVEDRISQDDEGKFRIYDPSDDTMEDKQYDTEEEILDVLWARAIKVDAPTLYGIDV